MGIKLHELKRKTIRWTRNGIEVYNPSTVEKEEIIKMLIPYMDEENQLIGVPLNDVVKLFLPKMSNIDLIDDEMTDEELDAYIDDIVEDAGEDLLAAIKVVNTVIQKLIEQVVGNVAELLELGNKEFAAALDITEDAALILRQDIDTKVAEIEGN